MPRILTEPTAEETLTEHNAKMFGSPKERLDFYRREIQYETSILANRTDAYLAAQYAKKHPGTIKAVILSNHGGRSLDTAPPPVHTLLEIRKYCPEVFSIIDVWIDGGIKRGTDIVKALCLGAKAVGVGRAALWGLGAGGYKGVERTFQSKRQWTPSCNPDAGPLC